MYRPAAKPGTRGPDGTTSKGQKIALVVTTAHLCVLPWALGTMHVWSQLLSLLLAVAGCAFALGPRDTGAASWRALLLSPGCWLGLFLLAYLLVQGLNPAWRYFSDGTVWWLETVDHIGWLPAGVDAPFAISNSWRHVLVFASLLLLLASLQVGLGKKASLRGILWALAINGAALSLFGIFQRLDATERMFWLWRPDSISFFATFIYQNHAGAYLNLIFALTAGFSLWHLRQATHGQGGAGSAGVLGFLAVVSGIGICFTLSRLSILIFAAQLVGFAIFFVSQRHRHRRHLLPITFAFALAAGLGALLVVPNLEPIQARFAQIAANPTGVLRSRSVVHQATAEMARDRWLFGWGAGSFRHAFPLYAQKYPELCHIGAGKTLHWEHAHSDPLETLAELGAIGSAPIAAALLLVVAALARLRFWRDPAGAGIVLGASALAAHSFGDLIFQSPAVLLSWAAALTIALRWLSPAQARTGTGSAPGTSTGRGSV